MYFFYCNGFLEKCQSDFSLFPKEKPPCVAVKSGSRTAVSDILPRLKRRGLPLARASSRFSFEQSTDYSISELTPCAPRFYWLWLCENDSHSFISDIDCSVYVSVVMCATFRAIPCSYAEILCFCVFVSTA